MRTSAGLVLAGLQDGEDGIESRANNSTGEGLLHDPEDGFHGVFPEVVIGTGLLQCTG